MKEGLSHEEVTEYDTVWDCKWLAAAGVPVTGLEVVADESRDAVKGQT